MITLYTIGFTKKSAEQFFTLLKKNKVKKLVDVRISNGSQLAGFAKGRDLEFFTRELLHIPYEHILDFATPKELLDKCKFCLGNVQELPRLVLGRAFAQSSVLNGKPPQLLRVLFAEQVKCGCLLTTLGLIYGFPVHLSSLGANTFFTVILYVEPSESTSNQGSS